MVDLKQNNSGSGIFVSQGLVISYILLMVDEILAIFDRTLTILKSHEYIYYTIIHYVCNHLLCFSCMKSSKTPLFSNSIFGNFSQTCRA